eukprot:scaffold2207_cov370-Prasinococcus_capsulatus_cf.AAC.5
MARKDSMHISSHGMAKGVAAATGAKTSTWDKARDAHRPQLARPRKAQSRHPASQQLRPSYAGGKACAQWPVSAPHRPLVLQRHLQPAPGAATAAASYLPQPPPTPW